MLEQALKDQVKNLFADLKNDYIFKIVSHPSHPNRDELITLLQEVSSCSDKVSYTLEDGEGLAFTLVKNGIDSSIVFRAVLRGMSLPLCFWRFLIWTVLERTCQMM